MNRSDLWLFRFAGFVISVSVMMGFWFLLNAPFSVSIAIGIIICLLTIMSTDLLVEQPDQRSSKQQRIRVRIAEIESRIEPDRRELFQLHQELAELESKKTYRG